MTSWWGTECDEAEVDSGRDLVRTSKADRRVVRCFAGDCCADGAEPGAPEDPDAAEVDEALVCLS